MSRNNIVALGAVKGKKSKLTKKEYLEAAKKWQQIYSKWQKKEKLPVQYKTMNAQDFDEIISNIYRLHDYHYTDKYSKRK